MKRTECHTEMLVLGDGRVLVHNLTPELACALSKLNPQDQAMKPRENAGRRVMLARASDAKYAQSRFCDLDAGIERNAS
jgi:hypothetical protein